MQTGPGAGILALAIVALGVAVLWNRVAAARRRRLRSGEIRELRPLWTTLDGYRVHARASFEAADPHSLPVVLVHGFGVSGSYFVPAAERLAAEFAVFVPDLPGHGRSDTPREPPDVPRLADFLIEWLDAVGLRRVSLVANSLGCQTAVDAAVRYPDRIDRLVLIGPTSDPIARTVTQLALRLLAGSPFERPSLTLILVEDYVRMGRRLIPEFRAMLRDRIEDKLPLVSAPVLLVRGAYDAIAPQRWLDEMAARLPFARTVVVPGAGHGVHYSVARRLVDVLVPFLRATHMTHESLPATRSGPTHAQGAPS